MVNEPWVDERIPEAFDLTAESMNSVGEDVMKKRLMKTVILQGIVIAGQFGIGIAPAHAIGTPKQQCIAYWSRYCMGQPDQAACRAEHFPDCDSLAG